MFKINLCHRVLNEALVAAEDGDDRNVVTLGVKVSAENHVAHCVCDSTVSRGHCAVTLTISSLVAS
jgi:hypothetical protein